MKLYKVEIRAFLSILSDFKLTNDAIAVFTA